MSIQAMKTSTWWKIRNRMVQGRHDAEALPPKRCLGCNKAMRDVGVTWCPCLPAGEITESKIVKTVVRKILNKGTKQWQMKTSLRSPRQ